MEKKNSISRRNFFSGLGVAAVAGAAIKITQTVSPPDAANSTPTELEGDGYRLTEHIKKYYRSTTI
jgi:hypothetical protein